MTSRPLQDCAVGISISESEDSSDRGFPRWQVNRATVQTAAALLGQGAGVVFGHDWREDGVMDAIYRFAVQSVRFELPPLHRIHCSAGQKVRSAYRPKTGYRAIPSNARR